MCHKPEQWSAVLEHHTDRDQSIVSDSSKFIQSIGTSGTMCFTLMYWVMNIDIVFRIELKIEIQMQLN